MGEEAPEERSLAALLPWRLLLLRIASRRWRIVARIVGVGLLWVTLGLAPLRRWIWVVAAVVAVGHGWHGRVGIGWLVVDGRQGWQTGWQRGGAQVGEGLIGGRDG